MKDKDRMREIYKKIKNLTSVINDPKIVGTINEVKAKMMMYDGNFTEAAEVMLDAFLNY